MLVKITDRLHVNTDYIVALSLICPKDDKDQIDKKYRVCALMIKGDTEVLAICDTEQQAKTEYNRFITASNKTKR